MSYWTGTHWVADDAAVQPPTRPSRARHVLGAITEGALLSLLVVALLSGTAFAARGNGKGNGNTTASSGGCVVDGTVVTGNGLPADTVINFMVTDVGGTWGWVLGNTSAGTWSVSVPERSGPTTYEFISKTWGPSTSPHYDVFASCSAE
jgi:hypothetical protein